MSARNRRTAEAERRASEIIRATFKKCTKDDPVIARIQLLDAEGEVISESDEIQVEPGKTSQEFPVR